MSQYYFFVSSLPYLLYDEGPPIEIEQFIDGARLNLSPGDFADLRTASIDAPDTNESDRRIIAQWKQFERGLRNALVRLRAADLDLAPESFLRVLESGDDGSSEPGLMEAAREAVANESPLAAEHMLGTVRWHYLSELETGHFFDLDAVIIYYLKLQVLSRNRLFSRKEGEEAYRAAIDSIMNDYYQEQV